MTQAFAIHLLVTALCVLISAWLVIGGVKKTQEGSEFEGPIMLFLAAIYLPLTGMALFGVGFYIWEAI